MVFKKGHIPWNNGKKIQLNTGRTHFKKGFIPWNKGKKGLQKHSKAWKKLKSKKMKGLKKISLKGREKLSRIHKGEKNHSWQGGISFEPYGLEFNNKLREQIRKRDNWICQECHQTQKQLKRKLAIHHIDFCKTNNNPKNLISLCQSCHAQTNFNRENWTNYFQIKIIQ